MEPSRFNIISKKSDSNDFFIVNLLSGHADVASASEREAIEAGRALPELIRKGYVVERDAEERTYRQAYLDFLDSRETDELQLFFAPWYTCNFACAYCYQRDYGEKTDSDLGPVIEAFFAYIDAEFPSRKKYITLFGGEPLLPSASARKTVQALLEGAHRRNLDTALVTNGYTLEKYLPLLIQHSIREIQVTLDGLEAMHDRRRPLKEGGGTFKQIVKGIDAALVAGLAVNLRFILDADNVGELAPLARFAQDRGWTGNPLYKTQIGRAYELHTCTSGNDRLYSRLGMYEALAREIKSHPEILEFHKPAFSVARFLFENERLPSPLFDDCPGAKTEWAFDGAGKIYSCTATIGKNGAELGEFYPAVKKNENLISRWQSRDVTSIKTCRNCALALACGGGCAAVAANKNGDLHEPDCRPVGELVGLGLSAYFPGPREKSLV